MPRRTDRPREPRIVTKSISTSHVHLPDGTISIRHEGEQDFATISAGRAGRAGSAVMKIVDGRLRVTIQPPVAVVEYNPSKHAWERTGGTYPSLTAARESIEPQGTILPVVDGTWAVYDEEGELAAMLVEQR